MTILMDSEALTRTVCFQSNIGDSSRSTDADLRCCCNYTICERAFPWLVLFVSIITGSAIGPTFKYLLTEKRMTAGLAAAWRNTLISLYMILPCLIELWRTPVSVRRGWFTAHLQQSSLDVTDDTNINSNGTSHSHIEHAAFEPVSTVDIEMSAHVTCSAVTDSIKNYSTTSESRMIQSAVLESGGRTTSEDVQTLLVQHGTNHGIVNVVHEHVKPNYVTPNSVPLLHFHIGFYVLAVAFTWALTLVVWVQALEYTTTVRASLFSSTTPLMLVVWMRLRGNHVSIGEYIGILVSVFGVALSLLEHEAPTSPLAWFGDLLCFLNSGFNAIYAIMGNDARQILPLFIYTYTTMALVAMLTSIYSVAAEHATLDFSEHGLFGWCTSDFLPLLIVFTLIVGFVGFLSKNYVTKVLSPVILATFGLVDSAVTGWMSWFAGIEDLPRRWTVIGGIVVTAGIAVVVVSEHMRKQEEAERVA